MLLTNIEIPTKTGQAFEVDALVIGEWGIYVVDVKGYIGRLNAGLHAWSLDELASKIKPRQHGAWFKQLLTALQYLHSLDIYHGAICPRNIICNSMKSVLVNFGVGLDVAASSYSQQHADPNLWALEGGGGKGPLWLGGKFY